MAEEVTGRRHSWKVKNFDAGLSPTVENDHPWAFRAVTTRRRSRSPIEIIAHSHFGLENKNAIFGPTCFLRFQARSRPAMS